MKLARRFSLSTTQRHLNVGFIGLGQMGSRMAQNLIKAEHSLLVHDAMPGACDDAVSAGAKIAQSPKEIASSCDVVVTMLRSGDQVREVYSSLFEGAGDGKSRLFIDSSTVDPDTPSFLDSARPKNVSILDAPVSGGIVAAASGSLTFMVGGPESAFKEGEPILKAMGQRVFHCGDVPGSGQIAKICNNLVLGISMCAVSEGMNLGTRLGMDPKKLAAILNVSSGRCWSSDTYNPTPGVMDGVPSSKNYAGGFATDLMRKDIGLALAAAQSVQAQTPLGASVLQLYDMLAKRGLGQKDFGVIYQLVKGSEADDEFTA